jgi:hypothetical protein
MAGISSTFAAICFAASTWQTPQSYPFWRGDPVK